MSTRFDAETNYYKILSVSENATPGEITAAHRTLARKKHPDMLPPSATPAQRAAQNAVMSKINQAKEVLLDKASRKLWEDSFQKHAGTVVGSTRFVHTNTVRQGDPSRKSDSTIAIQRGEEREAIKVPLSSHHTEYRSGTERSRERESSHRSGTGTPYKAATQYAPSSTHTSGSKGASRPSETSRSTSEPKLFDQTRYSGSFVHPSRSVREPTREATVSLPVTSIHPTRTSATQPSSIHTNDEGLISKQNKVKDPSNSKAGTQYRLDPKLELEVNELGRFVYASRTEEPGAIFRQSQAHRTMTQKHRIPEGIEVYGEATDPDFAGGIPSVATHVFDTKTCTLSRIPNHLTKATDLKALVPYLEGTMRPGGATRIKPGSCPGPSTQVNTRALSIRDQTARNTTIRDVTVRQPSNRNPSTRASTHDEQTIRPSISKEVGRSCDSGIGIDMNVSIQPDGRPISCICADPWCWARSGMPVAVIPQGGWHWGIRGLAPGSVESIEFESKLRIKFRH